MGCIVRRFAIPLSLLLALQAAFAAIAADSAQQAGDQNVQYHHRMSRRAYRHSRENLDVVQQQTQPQVPTKSSEPKPAKADVSPVAVMIEAMIVEVTLKSDSDPGVNAAWFKDTAKGAEATGNRAAINVMTGYNPATVFNADGKPVPTPEGKVNGLKLFFLAHGKAADALRRLESSRENCILAAPRVLVLNKQLADVQLGSQLAYQTTSRVNGTLVETTHLIPIGTRLKARPFVTADGKVRLEVFVERSSGHLDADGIPRVNAIQISTNLMVPDGATVVICGEPRTEVTQTTCPLPVFSCIPGPISLLNLIACSDSLVPSTDYAARKQLVVLISSQIVRQ
jgi:Flp pilus assembly secretin CpaC